MFPRLYQVSNNQSTMISDIGVVVRGWLALDLELAYGYFNSVWDEDIQDELKALIANVSLRHSVKDSWTWKEDKSQSFLVKSRYHLIS